MFLSTIILAHYASNNNVSDYGLRSEQYKQLNRDTRLPCNRSVYCNLCATERCLHEQWIEMRNRRGAAWSEAGRVLFVY